MRDGAAGLLQLGTFSITDIVPKALAELMRRHPGAAIRVREGAISELLTLLLQGELDCVFAAMPPDLLARGDIRHLRWQAMFDDRLCALLSDRHPLASVRSLRWRDLARARWVAMPTDTLVRQRFMEAFVREGLDPPQPVVETLSPEVRQLEAVLGRFWLFLRCAVLMDQWLRSVLAINSCSSKAIASAIDGFRLPALQ